MKRSAKPQGSSTNDRHNSGRRRDPQPVVEHPPRIIGGQLRGQRLLYSGDAVTRPMKDRTREAVFNLLGPAVQQTHVLDLFAGTGALGFEALSRGAAHATFFERHFPTAALIENSAQALGLADRCRVVPANTLVQFKRAEPVPDMTDRSQPWLVFVSPPYDLFVSQATAMLELLETVVRMAPAGSTVVVEADERFDFSRLPRPNAWNIRDYPPARVGLLKTSDS